MLSSSSTEDSKLQVPPPPIQVLDAITFEERFENNEVELISFNFTETRNNKKSPQKISLKKNSPLWPPIPSLLWVLDLGLL